MNALLRIPGRGAGRPSISQRASLGECGRIGACTQSVEGVAFSVRAKLEAPERSSKRAGGRGRAGRASGSSGTRAQQSSPSAQPNLLKDGAAPFCDFAVGTRRDIVALARLHFDGCTSRPTTFARLSLNISHRLALGNTIRYALPCRPPVVPAAADFAHVPTRSLVAGAGRVDLAGGIQRERGADDRRLRRPGISRAGAVHRCDSSSRRSRSPGHLLQFASSPTGIFRVRLAAGAAAISQHQLAAVHPAASRQLGCRSAVLFSAGAVTSSGGVLGGGHHRHRASTPLVNAR
eukprot:ctg_3644.g506